MLENWDFSRRSRKAVLDTFLSIFRILRTSKSSQRYENYNTFILMKSQTSFVRAPKFKYYSACNLKVREICAPYFSKTTTQYGVLYITSFMSMS